MTVKDYCSIASEFYATLSFEELPAKGTSRFDILQDLKRQCSPGAIIADMQGVQAPNDPSQCPAWQTSYRNYTVVDLLPDQMSCRPGS